jgi:hypothetical protein
MNPNKTTLPHELETEAEAGRDRDAIWFDFCPLLSDGAPDWWRLMDERRASTAH